MTEEEAREILEHIMELAATLGWESVVAQTKEGGILGLYIGTQSFLKLKGNENPYKITH